MLSKETRNTGSQSILLRVLGGRYRAQDKRQEDAATRNLVIPHLTSRLRLRDYLYTLEEKATIDLRRAFKAYYLTIYG